ncbi:MAG: hypothetical protein ACF8XB_14165 [Planctomycetota bacterium JB042]
MPSLRQQVADVHGHFRAALARLDHFLTGKRKGPAPPRIGDEIQRRGIAPGAEFDIVLDELSDSLVFGVHSRAGQVVLQIGRDFGEGKKPKRQPLADVVLESRIARVRIDLLCLELGHDVDVKSPDRVADLEAACGGRSLAEVKSSGVGRTAVAGIEKAARRKPPSRRK